MAEAGIFLDRRAFERTRDVVKRVEATMEPRSKKGRRGRRGGTSGGGSVTYGIVSIFDENGTLFGDDEGGISGREYDRDTYELTPGSGIVVPGTLTADGGITDFLDQLSVVNPDPASLSYETWYQLGTSDIPKRALVLHFGDLNCYQVGCEILAEPEEP